MTSPDGANIIRGFPHLTDAEGAVWTMDDDTEFRRNGRHTGGFGTGIFIYGGAAYAVNGSFHFRWTGGEGGTWTAHEGPWPPMSAVEPTTAGESASGTIVGIADPPLVDSEGALWTVAPTDFSILRNGVQTGPRGKHVEIWDSRVYCVTMDGLRQYWYGQFWVTYSGAWPPSDSLPVTFEFQYRTGVVLPMPGNLECTVTLPFTGPKKLTDGGRGGRGMGFRWRLPDGTDYAATNAYFTLPPGPVLVQCEAIAVLTDGQQHVVGRFQRHIDVKPIVYPTQ